jgi:hypothetical protein
LHDNNEDASIVSSLESLTEYIEDRVLYIDGPKTSIFSNLVDTIARYRYEAFNETEEIKMLDGLWELRLTTNPLSFDHRGLPQTLFRVNATTSSCAHIFNFPQNNGTVKFLHLATDLSSLGVKGGFCETPTNAIVTRESKRFKKINFKRPFLGLLRRFFKDAYNDFLNRCEYKVIYVNDDILIKKSDNGDAYVYVKMYDAWDPMKGWILVSAY